MKLLAMLNLKNNDQIN